MVGQIPIVVVTIRVRLILGHSHPPMWNEEEPHCRGFGMLAHLVSPWPVVKPEDKVHHNGLLYYLVTTLMKSKGKGRHPF